MVESGLFTSFSRLTQAYVWTKTKAFHQSCTLRFLKYMIIQGLKVSVNTCNILFLWSLWYVLRCKLRIDE